MEFQKVLHPWRRKRKHSGSRSKLSDLERRLVESQFEKTFSYKKDDSEDYKLLVAGEELCSVWTVPEYIAVKNELNRLKNNLNDKDMLSWHEHTRNVNLAGNIGSEIRAHMKPELCTQAWCKFYEIASRYLKFEDLQGLVSVHLCEAPGAFVTSLNQYLYTKGHEFEWEWLATTLNPYYEGNSIRQMIDDDKFIRCTFGNWYFGQDGTGNLMSQDNLKGLVDRLKDISVNLVTADGSIDCQGDPAEQENVVARLQHCEVLTALHILAPGGTLVIKLFTMLECKAICLMYLLNCVFGKVDVFKPCTSKAGNSEVYVIGLDFKGKHFCDSFLRIVTPKYFGPHEPEGCLFSHSDIPDTFLQQHTVCIQFFADCQMSAIQRNLDLFKAIGENADLPCRPKSGIDTNSSLNKSLLETDSGCNSCTTDRFNNDTTNSIDLELCVKDERSRLEVQKEFCVECFFERYDIRPLPRQSRLMNVSKKRAETKAEFATRVKMEGKFTGSFQERQMLAELPWQQKIYQVQTYEEEVTREDNSLWIQSFTGCFSEEEIDTFVVTWCRPVTEVYSSRFCPGFYLHQVQEILKHVQWLKEPVPPDSEFMNFVASKLSNILISTIEYYSNTQSASSHTLGDDMEMSGSEACEAKESGDQDTRANESVETSKAADCDKDMPGGHASENDLLPESKENSGLPAEEESESNSVGCRRPLCFFTSDRFESAVLQIVAKECSGGTVSVQMYSVCGDMVTENLDVSQHLDLLHAVLDIVKMSSVGDYAVLEIGTCLTRMSAALIYILYRSFREIGFVHHHGNLLKRHLVCIDYQGCPVRVQEYLHEVGHMMQTNQSEAVLEIVPVLYLLEDEKFTSFLSITNENLLQSVITSVINKERMKYPEDSP